MILPNHSANRPKRILQAYYRANEAAYTLSETKAITYAWVTPEMILDTIAIDDDALRALYEERASDYIRPERRLVERLVFADDCGCRSRQVPDRCERSEL